MDDGIAESLLPHSTVEPYPPYRIREHVYLTNTSQRREDALEGTLKDSLRRLHR